MINDFGLSKEILNELSEEDLEEINKYVSKIDLSDKDLPLYFGSNIQKNISKVSYNLNELRKKEDNDEVNKAMNELSSLLNTSELLKIKQTKGFFGLFKKNQNDLDLEKENILNAINKIEIELEKYRRQILRSSLMLQRIAEENNENLRKINNYILAGEIKLKKIDTETDFKFDYQLMEQEKTELIENTMRVFSRKLGDLRTSRLLGTQLKGLIDVLGDTYIKLIDKIQISMVSILPVLKKQISVIHNLEENKKSIEIEELKNNLLSNFSDIKKISLKNEK